MQCDICTKVIIVPDSGGMGYGVNQDGRKACYDCCAVQDKQAMVKDGRYTLYLDTKNNVVTNWPATLKFPVTTSRKSWHNMAGSRWDFWFNGPDGFVWHGYTIGDWTQIAHCKSTNKCWAA